MSNIKPSVSNVIVDENGKEYKSIRQLAKHLNVSKTTILRRLSKNVPYYYNGHTYYLKNTDYFGYSNTCPEYTVKQGTEEEYIKSDTTEQYLSLSDDFQDFLKVRDIQQLPFERYDFSDIDTKKSGNKYAIALFSDAHIEEYVDSNSVLGLNEYDINIAERRIQCYFKNLVKALNEDEVKSLIFASLGDTISSYIHDELAQTNQLTPLEATFKAQNLLYSGLEYIVENSTVEHIKFIGIVGNHSRTTKKIQHANGHVMSYEWLMYKNIEREIQLAGLPIEVNIPNSEMAIVEVGKKKFIFIHGFQIKGGNGIAGIFPPINRAVMKWERVFKQDKVYLGHFHNIMSFNNLAVNGSIIGYNSFSLSNGFPYEKPAQIYELYEGDNLTLTRKIYCE